MTTYTIDSDDHIATTTGTHKPQGTDAFSSLDELAQLAEPWPAARLVRVWNSLSGATAVKRFTDRKTAVSRIWKALQNGGGNSAAKSKTRRKNGARSSKPAARAGTKKAHIIRLLERPNGATVAEIMRATDWHRLAAAYRARLHQPRPGPRPRPAGRPLQAREGATGLPAPALAASLAGDFSRFHSSSCFDHIGIRVSRRKARSLTGSRSFSTSDQLRISS